eukprot:Amastigsp_a340105_398.p3 type:complete len:126 gc:universal Amastigsp_a340105_398:552-175(-)
MPRTPRAPMIFDIVCPYEPQLRSVCITVLSSSVGAVTNGTQNPVPPPATKTWTSVSSESGTFSRPQTRRFISAWAPNATAFSVIAPTSGDRTPRKSPRIPSAWITCRSGPSITCRALPWTSVREF